MDLLALTQRYFDLCKVAADINEIRGDNFDIKEFIKLNDINDIFQYIHDKNLQVISRGGSRQVYVYNPKYVLKVAFNPAGVAQNEIEDQLSNDENLNLSNLVTKVASRHPEHYWILSELVRPLTNKQEFESLSGVDYDFFRHYVRRGKEVPWGDPIPFFAERVRTLVEEGYLLPGDASKLNSWGKSVDGRLVLLDFGLTPEVREDLYAVYNEGGGYIVPINPSFEGVSQYTLKPEEVLNPTRVYREQLEVPEEQMQAPHGNLPPEEGTLPDVKRA